MKSPARPAAEPAGDSLKWPIAARPVVRVAGVFPLDARGFSYVYRSRFHALHLHEYRGRIRLDHQEFALEPGTFTCSLAQGDSSYDLPRPGMHWCIHFEQPEPAGAGPAKSPQASVAVPLVRPLGVLQGEAMRLFAQVARLHGLYTRGGRTDERLAMAASVSLQGLLVWLGMLDTPDNAGASPASDNPVERLVEYIDRNLNRRLVASELARQAGWSQNYLARLFRARIGLTLPRYILTRRIRLARLLLETTNLPIKQVALRVGLADAHYFNKQFRAVTGMSPTTCRTNHGS